MEIINIFMDRNSNLFLIEFFERNVLFLKEVLRNINMWLPEF